MAAAIGKPELANVFYYGKEFVAKKRKPGEKGQYKQLSVTKAGAQNAKSGKIQQG